MFLADHFTLVDGAISWLEANQDKTIEQLKEAQASSAADDQSSAPSGAFARSLLCDDCGKKFRDQAAAEYHAEKSGHENFSESTEEIKPLTAEEKKAKLEELRLKLAEKRAGLSEQDKLDKKKNDVRAPRHISIAFTA